MSTHSRCAENERQAAVFECRKAVARRQAEEACGRLAKQPPEPAFAQATLNVAAVVRGEFAGPGVFVRHDGSAGTPRGIPPSVSVAVEPTADVVSNELLVRGVWEVDEVRSILTALGRANATAGPLPPVLVDIGANVGVFSVVAAALGYPVIAFEAMARNIAAIYQTLCWNPDLRDRITLFPYALSDADQSCLVVSDTINVADGHLVCSDEEIAAMRGAHARAAAHSVRLGDYLGGMQADVLKMDVEGYEPRVLAGAGDVINGVQFALSEVSSVDMPKAMGSVFEEVGRAYLDAWRDRGFNITLCPQYVNCFNGQPMSPEQAGNTTVAQGIINILLQRESGPVRGDTTRVEAEEAATQEDVADAVPIAGEVGDDGGVSDPPAADTPQPQSAGAPPAASQEPRPLHGADFAGTGAGAGAEAGAGTGADTGLGAGAGAGAGAGTVWTMARMAANAVMRVRPRVELPRLPSVEEAFRGADEARRNAKQAHGPVRPDADCAAQVDTTLAPDKQAAELFACRKAAVREFAEAECERLARVPGAAQLPRVRLPLAEIAAGFFGAGATEAHDGTSADVDPRLPSGIGFAAERGAANALAAIEDAGSVTTAEARVVLAALQRANATAGALPPVLVDIGANLGIFSVAAAALGYPVIAFEANPRRVEAFHQTLCWNPGLRDRVTLFPYAVAGSDRTCHIAGDSEAAAAAGQVVCDGREAAKKPAAHAVHSVRLGEYLAGVQADVLKLDVEGYEARVLGGAGPVLESVQSAVSAVSPALLLRPDDDRRPEDAALEYLRGWRDRGFSVRLCGGDTSCADAPVTAISDAAVAAVSSGSVTVFMQRHSGGGGDAGVGIAAAA